MDEPLATITVELFVEFYLKNRVDPLLCPTIVCVPGEIDTVEELMDFALMTILSEVDTVGTHRVIVSDSRSVQRIVLMREIQSISLIPPDNFPRGSDEE